MNATNTIKLKDALPYISLGVSTASLGTALSNYKLNKRRIKEAADYQEQQLRAMDKLTRSLNKVDRTFETMPKNWNIANSDPEPKKKFLFFSQKNHSRVGDYALRGAVLGGTSVGAALPFIPNDLLESKGKKFAPKGGNTNNTTGTNPAIKKALIELGGIAIGASLGALAGYVMDLSERRNRRNTVNNRLMRNVVDNLERIGFIEGRDFVRDPKRANLMKIKTCLVISRNSDDLKLVINTANDPRLKEITRKITRNLPTMSTLTEKVSDRFNELNITTLASNSGDAIWITSLAEKFIKSGFPVYLVEVG